jgi:hypothetical protein
MPHKFIFVWDDNKIENQGEEFHFSNHFKNLSQSIYCDTFSEPVLIDNSAIKIIYFTDFKIRNGECTFYMGAIRRSFDSSNHTELLLAINNSNF